MSHSDPFDPYAELQLSPDAEPELIKAAFKALAKKYHPDKFSDPIEKKRAEERMARINEAQQLLASGNYRTPPRSEPPTPKARPSAPPPSPSRRAPSPAPKRAARPNISKLHILFAALILAALLALPGLLAGNDLQQALEFEKQGRLQDSLTYLNKAVKEDPHDRELYRHRARIWEKLGEPEKAAVDRTNAQIPQLSFPTPEPTQESTPGEATSASGENSESHVP
jgi:curved DNA-binding protein CbpA